MEKGEEEKMAKVKRKIIRIDEEKCDGCGLCIPSCPEGALQIIGGKARLVKESFCDGLGACLGTCPKGALTIEEKEVEEYDEEGVIAHLKGKSPEFLEKHLKHREVKEGVRISSELRQWPIQLHLVSSRAPYFQNAELILVADCVPFAYANFHTDFLRGKAIAIGCPKLDDLSAYGEKIKEIISSSGIKSLRVIHMEVPCCFGLVHIAQKALAKSGKDIPLETTVIGIDGEIRG
jgi:NAD-dependent dihydropyrimidine dehydrogenase PreA subunit